MASSSSTRMMRRMTKRWIVILFTSTCSLLLAATVTVSAMHRHLGDFDELNALLKDALIYLGDTSVAEGLILNLSLQNLRCTNFAMGDMNIASDLIADNGISMDQVLLDISITDLNMDCFFDYSYRTLIFRGSGRATIESRGSDAVTRTVLRSPDLNLYPPLLASLDSCNANVQLSNLQFLDGGILALAPVESLIRRIIENQATKSVCRELEALSTTQIVQWLANAKTALDKYPTDIGMVDPLTSEQTTLVIPDGMKLLNMQQRETEVGELFAFALEELVTFLSKEVEDPLGITPTGMDMRANVVMRNLILEDRALNLNVADFAFITDGVLWENEDKLTDTKITLNKIQLLGLDTLTRFRPFEAVGNYTIQNELAWEYLTFELDATIEIQPSLASDSVIVDPGTTRVVEDITIQFGVDNLGAVASFLPAIDQELLESLQLGSLLQSDDLLNCILSTIVHFEIPALSVFVANVQEPTLQGFVSQGLDRLFTDSAKAAFQMYESVLLNAAPAFFQIAVRNAMNKRIEEELNKYIQGPDGCPKVTTEVFASDSTNFIDFRDLMLEPEAAAAAGGSGASPYGDVMATVFSQMTERFLASGNDGLPKINSAILQPVTEAQSGEAGTLLWDEDTLTLFQYNSSSFKELLNQVEIQSTSMSLRNLDTIVQPLQLASVAGAHNLTNSVYMGEVANRPVSFSTDLLFRIDGEDSPLAVDNLFELTVSFKNAVSYDVLATLMRKSFMEFPLKDLMDINCWLAAFPAPDVDAAGNVFGASGNGEYTGLDLSRLLMTIDSLDFDVRCISCTSPGGEALPEIMAALKSSGATAIIEERFQNFANEMGKGYWDSMKVHQHIAEARQLCPHSPYFDATASSSFEWPGLPSLSRQAAESMMVFSSLAANFAIVLTAKSHLLRPAEPTNPFSGERDMPPLEDGNKLINWSDLGNSLGEWALTGLDEVRAFAGEMTEDKVTGAIDLGANTLIRDILEEDGSLEISLSGLELGKTAEIGATIARIRVFGLDTMLEANILDILGPQTIGNRMRFETLRVEIDVEMIFQSGPPETTTFSFQLNDVNVNISLLLAVDWNRLGEMQVGSMLQLKNILPCVVSKFHAIDITQLLVSAGSIDVPRISGFLSKDASVALTEASRQFLDTFADDLVGSIPKVFDMTVREILNSILLDYLNNEAEYCSYDSEVSTSGIIDFRDLFLPAAMAKSLGGSGMSPYGNTFRILFEAVQEKIVAVDDNNQTALNKMLVRPMTFDQSNVNGSLIFPGEVVNASGMATLSNWLVLIDGRMSDARVENLDTVGNPLKVFQPVGGQASVLNNSIAMAVGPQPLRMTGTMYLALRDDNEMNLENEVEVSLEVSDVNLILTAFLAMSESSFFALPLTNLQDMNCWLSSISPDSLDSKAGVASLFQYGFSAEKVNLNISCVSCGSPKFSELVEKLYNPGETEDEVSSFVAEVRDLVDSFLGSDFLQNLLHEVVTDAAKTCPVSPDYDPNAVSGDFWVQPETYIGMEATARDTKMNLFNIGNAIVAGVMLLSALIARFFIIRKNRRWLRSLPEEQADILRHQDEIEARKENFLNHHTNSMFRSEQIPRKIRYGVPAFLVMNIGMFLGAHIALLNYVNIEAQIAGEHFTVEHFLEFRFFEAALRTYNNGGSEMAIFLIFFSGVWPYIKLLAAIVLWFVPPYKLSVAHRGKIFLWMDVLTKLSIIDIVTMLAAIAALFVYIGGPGQAFYSSDELYAMTLVVVPQAGFYCIIIAQRLNRVSSRFFLEYHDKIVCMASEEYKRLHQAKLADQEIAFASGTFGTTASTKASPSYARGSVSFDESINNDTLESSDGVRMNRLRRPTDSTTGSLTCPSRFRRSRQEDIEVSTISNSMTSLAGIHLIEGMSAEGSVNNSSKSASSMPGPNRQDTSDFLIYSPDDDLMEQSPPKEVTLYERQSESRIAAIMNRLKCKCLQGEDIMGGTLAVIFAGVFVLILFIIGCTLLPSMSLDVNEVLGIALESGSTYEDAVNEFSVFRVVSLVLLETRFVLSSTADYVGLGILLFLAGLSVVLFPAMQAWKNLKEWYASRHDPDAEPLFRRKKTKQRKSVIPGFTNRLKVWNNMEVFVVSFCIASWQLGAVVAYIVHNYCDLLQRFFEALGYVGLVERTSINCFRVQASDPFTLLMLIGSFFLLLASFLMQMHAQYKKNKAHMEELLDEE